MAAIEPESTAVKESSLLTGSAESNVGDGLESKEEVLCDIPGVAMIKHSSGDTAVDASSADEAVELPSISVIIPTYNMDRWDYLCECVASAQAQTVPPLEIIVVVDHNPELLDRVTREMPAVVAVPNIGRRGVSGARNSGVKASRGEVAAFIDDDAIASPEWLATVVRHILDPEVVGAGCSNNGIWEAPRPAWFPGEFGWTIGESYSGMPETPVAVRNIWTCSMLVKRAAFELVDGFRDDFGKIGNRSLPEDTDLCLRIASAQDKAIWIYDPAKAMGHRVPADRATFAYFLSRCFYQGWGKAAMASMDGFGKSTSMERDYTYRILPAGVVRGVAETFRGDIFGVVRSANIVVGLGVTVAGYAWFLQEKMLRQARRSIGLRDNRTPDKFAKDDI
jgi:glycosyltransferase involved in cell wall biosynthesis